jgi:membrane dipeptidase
MVSRSIPVNDLLLAGLSISKNMRYSLILFFMLLNVRTRAQAYEKIHFDAILVDTHNDFLSKAVEEHVVFDTNLKGITQSDLGRMFAGGVKLQVFSIFCDEHYGKGSAFAYASRELDSLDAIISRNRQKMQMVYSYREIKEAVNKHKLACMAGVEGGHMMEDNLDYLDSFYKRGVRYMTLTWNNSTSWATSAMDESQQTFKVTPEGLNDYGKQVINKMNRLGMMVDVSHIGDKTFRDVMAITSKPVIASHSSVYTLCPVFRNLKDDQIKAIAKNGGVIQVNFYSAFLDSSFSGKLDAFLLLHQQEHDSLAALKKPEYQIGDYFSKKYKNEFETMRPPLSMLIDHIDYIVKLVGVDYVGLGSDFDGIDSAPKDLNGVEDFPKITEALWKRGYNKREIKKILGGNFLRVFKANDNHR